MLELRYLMLFVLGVVVGTHVNRGIYRLAWHPRDISPWSPAPPGATRTWFDRLPVVGWLALRREGALHGPGFWIRPCLIELGLGFGFAALYWHHVVQRGPVPYREFSGDAAILHTQYFLHLFLIALLMVATFIDFDEQTIPDSITVLGTLAGLALMTVLPNGRLLVRVPAVSGWVVEPISVVSAAEPFGWDRWLAAPLCALCGVLCFVGWSAAVSPWRWIPRRGFFMAVRFLVASWRRNPFTRYYVYLAGIGSLAILTVWAAARGGLLASERWESLFTALVGMTFSGGLIWLVRIVGSHALGQEAMGFGDVTLMAMIGVFVGWQSSLAVFFLAPFAAVVISVTQWLLTGRRDIAFGPYLSLAAVGLLLRFGAIWRDMLEPIFSLGWFVIGVVAVGLALMGILLLVMRAGRELLTGGH